MNDELFAKAKKLAAQPYDVEFEKDTYPDGRVVYLALNPELPGCMAQGATPDEAETDLISARTDYIYALLVEGFDVPEPAARQTITAHSLMLPTPLQISRLNDNVLNIVFEPIEPDFDAILGKIIKKDDREPLQGRGLRGDLVKHG